MKSMKNILVVILFLMSTSAVIADGTGISAADFTKLIKADKNVVVIDANKADVYGKMHVMNAVNIPHKDLYQEGAIEGLIKSPAELAKYFGSKGVSEKNTIIIYDDGSNKYSSRIYWVLRYLGANDVRILHKDMDVWKKARVPITSRAAAIKKKTFTPNVDAGIIVELDEVKSRVSDDKAVIIDLRAKEEYDGTSEKPVSKGHISKAVNINHKEFLNDKGGYKSKEQLQALMNSKGFTPDKEYILYCVTSVRAAVGYVALKEILGYNNVKIYDGAYNEWIADPSNPLN